MRYFSANEILISLIFAIFFGIASGGLYKSAECLTSSVRSVLSTVTSVWKASSIFDLNKEKSEQNNKMIHIKQNTFDFFFFIFLGTLYIFLCYLTLDGVFRIYMLIFAAASFFISKKTLGVLFRRVITFVFTILRWLVFVILYILTLPIKVTFRAVVRILSPPIRRILFCIKKRKSIGLANKKYRETAFFLKKLI